MPAVPSSARPLAPLPAAIRPASSRGARLRSIPVRLAVAAVLPPQVPPVAPVAA